MVDDSNERGVPTRRDYVKYGGAVLGSGLLAGCAGQSGSGSTSTEPELSTAPDTETETVTDDGSFTLEMFPVDEVEFEGVPESITTYNMGWADMVVSLGAAGKLETNRLSAPTLFYDRFDIDYDNDYSALWQSGGWSKEVMYERDPDVFLFDPNLLTLWDDNWEASDTEEIRSNVAPFFGCHNRRIRSDWQKEMGYPDEAPTMLEAFEMVGQLLGEEARAQAWLDLHADLQSEVKPRLPDEEMPSIALINSGSAPEKGTFYVLNLAQDGYEMKPYRDLGLVEADAFEGVETGKWGETDYETLLEVDPDIILVHWGITTGSVTWDSEGAFDGDQFHEKFVAPMERSSAGKKLTAVQNGRVLPGPTAEQGPLINAFQTELVARLFYPEEFGELDMDAPFDVREEQQLFDRQRVADIINGDI
jgi:iron complex transport system substrate-binding protein